MNKLNWREGKRVAVVPDNRCYEAEVEGGKYRIAPWLRRDRVIQYEAFFIPAGAESMADVRDIATQLSSIEEARAVAESDYENLRKQK